MQRVAIGRALVNDPRILLADEPTGNLDSVTADGIYAVFEELHREGLTLIVVTHNTGAGKTGRAGHYDPGRVRGPDLRAVGFQLPCSGIR